jgi:hypothetical protein
MEERNAAKGYLAGAIQRLRAEGFGCSENVPYRDQVFSWVARRTRFELTKSGFSETFFVFAELPSVDRSSLRRFSAKSFRCAKKMRRIPLPCGLFESVWCFPVALVDGIDADTSEAVRNETPPRHWASAEIPVVYDLTSGALCYFEKTPIWGRAYYAKFRKTIREVLGP